MSISFRLSLLASAFVLIARVVPAQDSDLIRPKAVLNYTFDEDSGPAKDSATAGQVPDEGKLVNDPPRVSSPFWNQSGKKAVQLDAARQQHIEISDSADVDCPTEVSFGMFVVNLTEPTDAAYHGLVAKRGVENGRTSTNYGINFQMQGDNFQVYIHDGTSYKVVAYSAKDALPYRKLVYITATFQVADAPKQDDDTDVDDLKIAFYVNGEPLTPKSAANGYVDGKFGWIKDIAVAGLLNNLPVTIGRSEAPAGEYLSCVVDEFSLFQSALQPAQAKKLFQEVAGANALDLIAQDKPIPAVVPVIGSLSQPGLQIGQTTQLVVNGSDLGPNPVAVFAIPGVTFAVAEGSAPNRLVLNVTVPPTAPAGIFPLWVRSQVGISKSVALAVDHLPQTPIAGSAPNKPASLPSAFFGNLAGGQQHRVYFAGTKGQRVVADVELKRLGGAANPVLEIKSPEGTPLEIGWGHVALHGDARVEKILPSDGVYSVELHDLTYNAPGQNLYRLKVGDLKLIDGTLPAAMVAGQVELQPIGSGFPAGTRLTGQFTFPDSSRSGLLTLPADSGVASIVPSLPVSQGLEIVEAPRAADGAPQAVDATFAQAPIKPVAISGVISAKGEHDRYLLSVTPGKSLRFLLQSDTIGSPLEGEIRVLAHPQGNPVAMTSDQPSIADLALDYAVPAGVTQIQVQVSDLFGRGSPRSFYRLVIQPAGRPSFSLMLNTPTINLPEDGSAMIEMQVTRAGYAGPIKLHVAGDNSVIVSPNEIAPNMQGKLLLRMVRAGKPVEGTAPLLRISGESVGVDPAITSTAKLQTGAIAPTFVDTMAVGTTAATGLSIEITQLPTVLFKGVSPELSLALKRQAGHASAALPIKLTLESTEPVRKRDNNNPAAGNFPVVAAAARMVMPGEPEQASIKLTVPLEVAEPVIDFVVKAEATPHAYSDRVLATAYSQPFRAEVKNAVAPKAEDPTLTVVAESDHKVTGVLQRTAGFTGPVEATLVGLPAEYTVQTANVAGDQDKFEIIVKAPKVAAETPVANVKLRVTSAGSLLVAEIPVTLKVIPKP
ncbi:MAG: hypothetical protein JSS49_28280 [Planctomycetes bacterium]|nr:hypothetical protein [Planctomycetota bacterium]